MVDFGGSKSYAEADFCIYHMADCRMVLKTIDGRMIAIAIIAGEDKVAGSTYQRPELDY